MAWQNENSKRELTILRPGVVFGKGEHGNFTRLYKGIKKRYFVVVYEYDEGQFENYIIINPRITSESKEMIYVEEGEGCLSVNRPTVGIVPRHARITMEGFDMDGNPIKYRVREDVAIAFQHELDHLNGILFIDRIDPKNPYKDKDKYRSI